MSGIVRADGQSFDDVEEVLILVRHRGGREDGWIIHEPDKCEWRWGGIGRATVTIRGEFYRKAKDNQSREFERRMERALSPAVVEDLEAELMEGRDG